MKITLKDIVFIVTIIVLFFMLTDQCSQKKEARSDAEELANYKDTVMVYKAKDGTNISYNKALIVDRDNWKRHSDSITKALKNLKIKKPTSYTKIKQVLKIDTVTQYVFKTDTLPCAPFVKNFTIDSSWYKFDVSLTNKDFTMSNFLLPNRQDIIVGTKKNGLFKRNEYIVTVQNTNPHMTVTGIQSYTLKPDVKFYNKIWFRALEVGAAFIIGRQAGKRP